MIIGITGGTGCGKTTLLHLIAEFGGRVIDCDAVYHQLLASDKELLSAIEKRFPGTVENGILNRKALGTLVFSDPAALQELNTITHKAVSAEVRRLLTPPPELAAIDAFALFESGLSELCQLTVAVTAPREDRIRRLMRRDHICEEYAAARIDAQLPQEEFVRLCDRHLINDGTQDQFREKCLAFLRSLGIMKEE